MGIEGAGWMGCLDMGVMGDERGGENEEAEGG